MYWHPEGILKVCEGRSPHIGACVDIGYWIRSGIDPREGVRQLGKRLITVQMHDLHAAGPDGHDVPWGTGVGRTRDLIAEIQKLGLKPTMFGLEYSYDWMESLPKVAKCAEYFNQVTLELAK